MKRCLCCHTEAKDEAQSCASCGEGSWSKCVSDKPKSEAKSKQDKPKKRDE